MNKTTLDMSAFMDAYTAKVVAEDRRRQELRDRVAAGDLTAIAQWGRTSNWHISDRH